MKRMLLRALVALFLLSGRTPLAAQSVDSCRYALFGSVLDEHDGQPLPFSNIVVEETQGGAIASEDGSFRLEGFCRGTYTLVFSHIGCGSRRVSVQIPVDSALTLYLEHHAEMLEGITVIAAPKLSPHVSSSSSLEGVALERLAGQSLAASLSSMAGVETLQTGPTIAKPVIHGLHSSRVLIFNNGLEQEGQEWGTDHAPEIDPFTADRLTVIKGTGAVRYGLGALGGVVLVEPAPLPRESGLGGRLQLVGMTNGGLGAISGRLQGGSKKWAGFGWRVQGTYRIAGDAHAPEYQLTNTGLRENNLSLGLGWQREAFSLETYYSRFYTELGILRSAHIGNLTDLQAALASGEPQIVEDFSYSIQNPRQQVVHDLFKLRGNWQLGNAGALEAQYGLQRNHRQEFDIRRGDRSDIPALDLELTTHNQEIVFTHRPWWDRWKGSIGLTGSYNRNRNVPGTGTKPLIPWYNNLEAGLFWVEKWLQEKYELEFGLRYDHRYLKAKTFDDQQELVITRLNYQGFTASLGGRYHLTERWTLRLNLGTAIRPPNVSELFSDGLHHAIASIEEGNVDLSPERSAKAVLNLTHENDDRFRLELDGYYQLIDRYIFLQPEPELRLTIRGAFPVFTYRQTDATLAGFDAYVQFRLLSHLFLEGKGSLVRGFDRGADDDLIFLPPPRGELHLKYVLAAAGRVKDLQFDLGVRRSWEQKHFPEGVDFVPPPSAYTLLTAGFSMNYLLGAHPLGIHLRIDNLLDTPYREYLNRLRYYADEAGRNVELRLSYEF